MSLRTGTPGSRTLALATALLVALDAARAAAQSAPPGAANEIEFPVVLGTYATTLVGSLPERTANIRLAAEALDGIVLAPGAVLSFNDRVGPRTLERGYQSAPVILHERRQVQAGGGICQVASTLFVAALLSGLTPVERWRHSTPVDYIAVGHDATIAWGAKDLRVRNTLGQRVRVRLEVLGGTLAARIEAEEATRVSYELETDARELPADPGVEGGASGLEVDLFRVRRDDGATVAREFVHRDVIPPSRGVRPPEAR